VTIDDVARVAGALEGVRRAAPDALVREKILIVPNERWCTVRYPD